MGKPSKAILDFMSTYNVEKDEVWEVHGTTWVVKHKALERVAADQKIIFEKPELKVCDMAGGLCVVLISAKLNDRVEHSFGEASPKNNKNAYPVAMAEKRAKDRVILKLLAAHGSLYSEAEADEFEERRNPHVTRPEDIFEPVEHDQHGQPVDNIPLADPSIKPLPKKNAKEMFSDLQNEIWATGTIPQLSAWAERNKDRVGALPHDWQQILRGVYAEHRDAIRNMDAKDNERLAS